MLNLTKTYNAHLDIIGMDERTRTTSLLGVFNRDIVNNPRFTFRGKPIFPTPKENGEDAMGNLFNHLTRKMEHDVERHRVFDMDRSVRLHWIRHHIEERKQEHMLCFSVEEPAGKRTYIYDVDEEYVIILEPRRNGTAYYLLTAFHLQGKDVARNKIMVKYKKRRLDNLL